MKEMSYKGQRGNEIKIVADFQAKEDYTMVAGEAVGNGKWFISPEVTIYFDSKVVEVSRSEKAQKAPANNSGIAYVIGKVAFDAERAEQVNTMLAEELAEAESHPEYAAYVAKKDASSKIADRVERDYAAHSAKMRKAMSV